MIDVSLSAVPNQELSLQVEDVRYDLTVKEGNGCMVVSVVRNGETILQGARAVAGSLLIPAIYQEAGNFIFETQDDALPYYDQFGTTQFLVYLTAAELDALRG